MLSHLGSTNEGAFILDFVHEFSRGQVLKHPSQSIVAFTFVGDALAVCQCHGPWPLPVGDDLNHWTAQSFTTRRNGNVSDFRNDVHLSNGVGAVGLRIEDHIGQVTFHEGTRCGLASHCELHTTLCPIHRTDVDRIFCINGVVGRKHEFVRMHGFTGKINLVDRHAVVVFVQQVQVT